MKIRRLENRDSDFVIWWKENFATKEDIKLYDAFQREREKVNTIRKDIDVIYNRRSRRLERFFDTYDDRMEKFRKSIKNMPTEKIRKLIERLEKKSLESSRKRKVLESAKLRKAHKKIAIHEKRIAAIRKKLFKINIFSKKRA